MQIQLHKLLSVDACFVILRELRWEQGVFCPHCNSLEISRSGKDDACSSCQRYVCKKCRRRFDDLSGTIFSGSHHPLTTWITVLYLMNLNVSNAQIAEELALNESSVFDLCSRIREGIVKKNLLYNLAEKLNLTNVI